MMTQPKPRCHRWMVVLISLFTAPFQLLNAEDPDKTRLLLDNTRGDAEQHHLPSSLFLKSSSEAGEIDDDEADMFPAWFAYLLAIVLFCISMVLYFTLLFWGDKLENEKGGAELKASSATDRKRQESVGHVIRSRRWSSFLDHPMTPLERWVISNHAVIRNFICSALVFFAIPNLIILGGLQQNFEATLFGVLMGIAGCLSISIVIKIFYDVHEEISGDRISNIISSPYNTFEASNKYEHFGLPLLDVIILGSGQITLLALYTWGLYEAGPPMFYDSRRYMYYMLGILMQIAYGHDKKIWNTIQDHVEFWIAAFRADRLDMRCEYTSNDETHYKFDMKHDKHIIIRFILSTLINTTGMFMIMMGLPIQVAAERDPLDFVLNVVAAFYIVEMDDLGDLEHAKFKCIIDPTAALRPKKSQEIAELSGTRKTHKEDPGEDNDKSHTLFDRVLEDLGLDDNGSSNFGKEESPLNNKSDIKIQSYEDCAEVIKCLQEEVKLLKSSNKAKDEDMKQFKDEMIIFKSHFKQAIHTTPQNESSSLNEAPNRIDSKREPKGLSHL